MPTYDPSLPVRADDGGADHLRRARTCLRDAKPREAHTHLVSAVEMGNADAMGELSFGTLLISGFPSDVAIAFQHASAGHALGSAIATAALAWCYMNGWGCPEIEVDSDDDADQHEGSRAYNQKRATELSQQAAAAGEPRGMSVVAWLRREHEDYTHEQQHALVFALWKRGAYLGDPWCTYSVANAYEEGIGVEKDSDAAQHWYLRAAQMGDTESMFLMARNYIENGSTVAVHSPDVAIEWLVKSAKACYPTAMELLISLYEDGCDEHGIEADEFKAEHWKEQLRLHDIEFPRSETSSYDGSDQDEENDDDEEENEDDEDEDGDEDEEGMEEVD